MLCVKQARRTPRIRGHLVTRVRYGLVSETCEARFARSANRVIKALYSSADIVLSEPDTLVFAEDLLLALHQRYYHTELITTAEHVNALRSGMTRGGRAGDLVTDLDDSYAASFRESYPEDCESIRLELARVPALRSI